MSEKFTQHFCEFEVIKMTQHFTLFEIKMTLTGLASSYLVLELMPYYRYIIIYCRMLFIINKCRLQYIIQFE